MTLNRTIAQTAHRYTRPAGLWARRLATAALAPGLGAVLAACGLAPPDTGLAPSTMAVTGGFPVLLDQQALANAAAGPQVDPEDATGVEDLAARVAALESRAAGLNRPVMDAATRARLEAIISPY